MERVLIALLTGIVSAGATALAVPRVLRVAQRYDILSYPSETRWVHTTPVARFGGVAMFLGFTAALAMTFVLPVERFPVEVERIALVLAGAAIVVMTMVYDDLMGLSPVAKLAGQVLAASVVVLPRLRGADHGLVIEQFNNPFGGVVVLPLAVAIGFTFFWIVGMMNTLNWVDGLDGLAGMVTLVASAVLFIHTFFRPAGNPQFTISLLAVALGAAVIGFLPYNWHPARIIMGDSGAMFLGYTLAVVAIIGGAKIATALLALWLPILDVAWLIVYRVLNGRSPLVADRGHLHHRLLDLGWSQQRIVLLFAVVSAGFGAAALLIPAPLYKLATLVVAGTVGLVFLAALARYRPEQSSGSVAKASRRL